jgi:hypothetical protein
VHLPPCGAHQVEPADRVAPSRGGKSRTDTQDAQGLCVAAHDSVPLHALKANNVGSVEKPADEEPSGRRFLEWVVRHAGWARSESIQPVAKTGVLWAPEQHAPAMRQRSGRPSAFAPGLHEASVIAGPRASPQPQNYPPAWACELDPNELTLTSSGSSGHGRRHAPHRFDPHWSPVRGP